MSIRAVSVSGLLAVLLLTGGCQPLKYEKSLTVDAGDIQTLTFDPPRYEQKLKVQVSSPGSPVSVYLVRESEAQAVQQDLNFGKAPASPLAGKDKAEEITLEATIPAKTGFALVIHSKKKAEVKVNVTGR